MVGYCICGDYGPCQGRDFLFHHYIKRTVVIYLEIEVHVIQRIAAQAELAVTYRQRYAVESVRIGNGIGPGPGIVDRHACQGLSGGNVPDMAAEIDLSAAARTGIAYLVDLVGICNHCILLREEALEPVIVYT